MSDEKLARALRWALLALRVTLALFLLQWGVEKFVVPSNTSAIWGYFYGLSVPDSLGYGFGAIEIALALAILLGVFRTLAYGASALLHLVTVIVSWRQLIDPWGGGGANHLFIASVPVLGAFVALYLLRHWDKGLLDRASAH